MSPRIVLASTSPWRLELLRKAGVDVEGMAPGVDEDAIFAPDPVALARARARAKALAVSVPAAVVIGADQVAHLDGQPFGKPADPEDHRRRLRSLAGRTHVLSTAVCIVAPDGACTELLEEARITFRSDLPDSLIDAYVAHGEGSGCAGGYAVEGLGAQLLARIDGDLFTVIGLPVLPVLAALRAVGWRGLEDPR